jgi:hypothetical protein
MFRTDIKALAIKISGTTTSVRSGLRLAHAWIAKKKRTSRRKPWVRGA